MKPVPIRELELMRLIKIRYPNSFATIGVDVSQLGTNPPEVGYYTFINQAKFTYPGNPIGNSLSPTFLDFDELRLFVIRQLEITEDEIKTHQTKEAQPPPSSDDN